MRSIDFKLTSTRMFLMTALITWTVQTQAQGRFFPEPNSEFFPQRSVVSAITANIAYQGFGESQPYFGQGEYEIFLDNVDGVLDRPVIVLDGFDPGDGRGIGALYASLSYGGQNLADELRDLGFDIVVLNAPNYITDGYEIGGGGDFIQRNAMVLIALIQELNAQKQGDEELVVLGPSMGGLIARYALAYMEQEGLPHETRLYLSFDSPHRGANIPIALQYLINYFAVVGGDPMAQATVDFVLNSSAAKQMLVDHLSGHLLAGSDLEQDPNLLLPAGAPNFRDEFQQELDALGFPQNVRNVTMINGAVDGTNIGSPGMEVVNTSIEVDALTDIDIALYFTPEAGQNITVTDVATYFIGIPVSTFSADAQSPGSSDGVDSAPGGTGNISAALAGGGGSPVLQEFIDALNQDEYSFIPTMSALAIDTDNWHGPADLTASPFDNIEASTINSGHVSLTQSMADFAIIEIFGSLSNDDFTAVVGPKLRNPAKEAIELYLPQTWQQSTLKAYLYSLDGRLIAQKEWEGVTQNIQWTHELSQGIYLLELHSGTNSAHLRVLKQ
ncbi:MAG: T9SS type A sorting domain-containing protein, partial [Bacteroidetes bacterium]|nr:T9SS type A sorting domain-containing protein [Bacteroidota bacterium]